MAFTPVPNASKKQIDKAGKTLTDGTGTESEIQAARDLADQWRACHAYPINTFQATLRKKVRRFGSEVMVAQRLKRMPTIIDKLKRYPNMKLTTMQDIGGVRAILNSAKDAYSIADEFRKNARLAHELVDQKDYIDTPRDIDGYRSLHIIYKYKNKQVPTYDGLRLELQIRTRLQHTWATAVETMGTFLGQALKSKKGDQDWLEFFAIVSSAFAHQEKRPPVPRFASLSMKETYQEVAKAERRVNALDKMEAFSNVVETIEKSRKEGSGRSSFYHLIILDSLSHGVTINAYDRDSFSRAIADYSAFELEAEKGAKIEPVLVAAGPIDKLRKAYPNFFLDINDFLLRIHEIVGH